MKRILALGLCLALLCPAARAAEEAKGWSRSEPGGDYVTLRVPCPQGRPWIGRSRPSLAVRYADTGEPVPLTSDYQQGWLFATVPAEGGGAAPGGLSGGGAPLPRLHHGLEGARVLQRPRRRKGAVSPGSAPGDHAGNLNPRRRPDAGGGLRPDLPPAVPGARRRPRLRRRGSPATGIMIPPPPPGPADWRRRTPISTPTGW